MSGAHRCAQAGRALRKCNFRTPPDHLYVKSSIIRNSEMSAVVLKFHFSIPEQEHAFLCKKKSRCVYH
jgi:hypothetical protein